MGRKKVVEYVTMDGENISFYDFCEDFLKNMRNNGQDKSADNYLCALNHFRKFCGESINFMDISSYKLTEWIKTLSNTKRAKESYPKAIKTMFEAGKLKYNDYNNNIIRMEKFAKVAPFRQSKLTPM